MKPLRAAIWLTIFVLPAQGGEYVGSESCQSCHESAWASWRQSDHYQAMLPASDESVLGDFNDAHFQYAGKSHRFFRKDGKFLVETDNSQGKMQELEIEFTFGFYPLQQYLIGFPDGRYQALNIVWDSRTEAEGGQRWYHLYPGDAVGHDDILHWTGSFQNWNSRCAACHSTELKKNYSRADNSYRTSWAEINVGCEACHGPGAVHADWARKGLQSADPGFSNVLNGGGEWVEDGLNPTRHRQQPVTSHSQVQVCAACHSRRMELDENHVGKPFDDLFELRLLEEDLYFADGQVRDETYVYGSFLQSRMFQAGVACTNCHDPHSGKLVAEGNAVCGQCHQATVFDRPEHHHHPAGSSGAACVNCHMPATTYMGVDARRDHSFRVPEPKLTIELGIPNACNRCHEDRDAGWAEEAVRTWNPESGTRAVHAAVLAAARQNKVSALPGLIALANDPTEPGIVKATAVLESGRFPSQESLALIQSGLGDPDPLVRAAAVNALDALPLANRYSVLQPLITDPSKSVRMSVARQLAALSPNQLSANGQAELITLRNEYLEFLKLNSDMPEILLNLGSFLALAGQAEEAESAYRQALKLAPQFVPAMINLADLYRTGRMEDAASTLLQTAIDTAPESAPAQYAMGLLLVRTGQLGRAIGYLRTAAELEPFYPRYTYVYAVALYESGQQQWAVQELEQALLRFPGNAELGSALGAYYQQLGESEKLRKLQDASPN